MFRAVVVAGEAGEARAVVFPLWLKPLAANYVLGGTCFRADTAFNATVAVYLEFLVGDEMLHEETAEKPRVGSRPTANNEMACRLAVNDILDILFQFGGGFVLLGFLLLGVVNVEEGQSQIRLWHDERERRAQWQPLGFQVFTKNIHCLANVVASRA